jgi:hypothetical protein
VLIRRRTQRIKLAHLRFCCGITHFLPTLSMFLPTGSALLDD